MQILKNFTIDFRGLNRDRESSQSDQIEINLNGCDDRMEELKMMETNFVFWME